MTKGNFREKQFCGQFKLSRNQSLKLDSKEFMLLLVCWVRIGDKMRHLLIVIILVAVSVSNGMALTFHTYFTGTVEGITGYSLLVSGRIYKISPEVKVLAHENRNGAIYELPARMSELSSGDSVTVRIEASIIKEIIIERWKR